MDLLRECYEADMRFYRDSCENTVRVRWFFVERKDFVPITPYVSSAYDEEPGYMGSPVGELWENKTPVKGNIPPGALISPAPCGTEEEWYGQISLADRGPRCELCGLTSASHVMVSNRATLTMAAQITVPCCAGVSLPTTLMVTIPTLTCTCGTGQVSIPGGTYALTLAPLAQFPQAIWNYCSPNVFDCPVGGIDPQPPPYDKYTGWGMQFYCVVGNLGPQGFYFQLGFTGDANINDVCGGPTLGWGGIGYGKWKVAQCSPAFWQGDFIMDSQNCPPGNAGTVTIKP